MSRYIDDHLAKDEKIIYETRLHWMVFFWSGVWGVVGFFSLLGIIAAHAYDGIVSLVIFLFLALILGANAYLNRATSEFALTDKRVILKIGFISRRTIETQLNKVESFGVEQGILGRMLDYGTISISGTGGRKELFKKIEKPLEFKKKVQEQIG
jgi:uncharacterized membrane protein YdbT with pleckstrin-like domain